MPDLRRNAVHQTTVDIYSLKRKYAIVIKENELSRIKIYLRDLRIVCGGELISKKAYAGYWVITLSAEDNEKYGFEFYNRLPLFTQ